MVEFAKTLLISFLVVGVFLFSGCENDLNQDVLVEPCITNIMCDEGYVSYDTGEVDENDCPIMDCKPEDHSVSVEPCITNIMCDEGYRVHYTDEVDENDCPIMDCKPEDD